jgi:hypothetical protein
MLGAPFERSGDRTQLALSIAVLIARFLTAGWEDRNEGVFVRIRHQSWKKISNLSSKPWARKSADDIFELWKSTESETRDDHKALGRLVSNFGSLAHLGDT